MADQITIIINRSVKDQVKWCMLRKIEVDHKNSYLQKKSIAHYLKFGCILSELWFKEELIQPELQWLVLNESYVPD